MSFNSISFLMFLCFSIFAYAVIPAKWKIWSILGISYLFYGLYDWKVLLFLAGFSLVVYIAALLIEKKSKKIIAIVGIVVVLMPLLICKYSEFLFQIKLNIVLPLGISYFTFKSIGYLADVRKGKISAEKNFAIVAGFVSFFPEILIGPIDRASDLMVQMKEPGRKMTWETIQIGGWILFGGYFEKVVVADRLGILVNEVYGDLYTYEGLVVLVAVLAYSLQIYFDFAGCTHMAIGVGKMLGFNLPENFRQPYLATSVEGFWRRWHMSLTSWLRDYIYIPLGGNRKGIVRKYINVMIVFLVSGIWHGAGMTFLIWGALNGAFQIMGALFKNIRSKIYHLLRIEETSQICIWWKRGCTFLLMTIAWIFFRSRDMEQAILVFKKLFATWNPWVLFDGTMYQLGLSQKNLNLLLLLLLIMAVLEVLHERKIWISQWVMKQNFIVRCLISYLLVFTILILGIYGTTYDASNFIYMKF